MTLSLSDKVARFCQQQALLTPTDKIVIGVSGGPDSLCLLHLLTKLAVEFQLGLTVAHLNHQLRDEAQADENFVHDIAQRWGLPFFSATYNIAQLAAKRKESLEETARQVRYKFLWQVAEQVKADKIAVGHNAGDQAETVLMHFLRGTGSAGLRGMLPIINIGSLRLDVADSLTLSSDISPKLIRPLLETPRAEIEDYCRAHQLAPRQDVTNQDLTFFRNRLRHELIPQLESYNPNIRHILQRAAKVMAAEVEFLNEHIDQAWQAVVKNISPETIEFDLDKWLSLPLALKRSTLRRAVQSLRRSLRDLSFEHVEQAIAIVEQGGTGKKAVFPQQLILTIGYDSFVVGDQHRSPILPASKTPYLRSDERLPLNLPGVTPLPGATWQLKANLCPISDLEPARISQVTPWESYLDADVAGKSPALRPRHPGDIFFPLGLAGRRQKVSDFMINEKIPVDQRNRIPLLVTAEDHILWVCGYRLDERACIKAHTQHVLRLKFERFQETNSYQNDCKTE